MPNHITNIMTVSFMADSFFDAVKSEDRDFDFNEIIPRPEQLQLRKGCNGIKMAVSDAAELVMLHDDWPVFDYKGKAKSINDIFNYGHKREWEDDDFLDFAGCCKAIMECGYSNWHPWNVVHWGTKWNAYDVTRNGDEIRFDTHGVPL